MNAKVKRLWLKALRSGGYKQGTGQLKRGRKDPRHCCLGVLEEVAKDEGVIKSFRGTNGFLDDKVIQWAGLVSQCPSVAGNSLAFLNDNGKDFNYIADQIEEYL